MPTVEVTQRLAAPVEDVWRLVCAVEDYPRFMEPVRSVRVLSHGPNWSVHAWEVVLKGSVLTWVERQERDDGAHHVAYHQLDGDLEVFDGFWRLRALSPTATEAILVVRFEIGIPMLRTMLDPVAERAIRQNARAMLLSLGPALEPGAEAAG
ncbi:MAG: type II toxin-antitoxin system RatA family toxin [Acidimicrobiia bacterium]